MQSFHGTMYLSEKPKYYLL